MSQLDNFRESLKRRDIPTDEENGMRDVVPCRKEMGFRRTSIGLSGELHSTIKALSFWMKKTGVKENPRRIDASPLPGEGDGLAFYGQNYVIWQLVS